LPSPSRSQDSLETLPEVRDLKVTVSPTSGLLGDAEKSACTPTVTVRVRLAVSPKKSLTVKVTRYEPGLRNWAVAVGPEADCPAISHCSLTTSALEVDVNVTVSPGAGLDGEKVNDAVGAAAAIRGKRRASPSASTTNAPERLKRVKSG
jgi:hypothetical protein